MQNKFEKITEQESKYRHLEKMPVRELLANMNAEDQLVPVAVQKELASIEKMVEAIVDKMMLGGRLFYMGAGTSGRLAIVDASECPPTFGVPAGMINAIIAGGNTAIVQAVENAEDDMEQGWKDLQEFMVSEKDFVIGLAASGTTPYVIGALEKCAAANILTGSISCNKYAPVSAVAKYPVEIIVGPEFVTGSTRLKSGTAQKLVLNMISTSVMIQLGRVEDNKMVHMQLTNEKLVDRGVKMVMEKLQITDYELAKNALLQNGSIKTAIEMLQR